VTARYERGSIVLTSNTSYGDWGNVFGDTVIATAVLDRLLHHTTTLNMTVSRILWVNRKTLLDGSETHKRQATIVLRACQKPLFHSSISRP
jgi:hypothetical protein